MTLPNTRKRSNLAIGTREEVHEQINQEVERLQGGLEHPGYTFAEVLLTRDIAKHLFECTPSDEPAAQSVVRVAQIAKDAVDKARTTT